MGVDFYVWLATNKKNRKFLIFSFALFLFLQKVRMHPREVMDLFLANSVFY